MKRVLPSLLVLVPLACRGEFDVDKYLVADGESESSGDSSGTLGESGSESASESGSSESGGSESETTEGSGSESESSDTDVACMPGELDLGSVCIDTKQILNLPREMAEPGDIALADFTGDFSLDLLVASAAGVTLWPSSNGQFGAGSPITGAFGIGLAVDDVNDDGSPDFAAVSFDQTQIFLSNGGEFSSPTMLGFGGHDAVFADLDGDLDGDLVVSGAALRTTLLTGGAFGMPFSYPHAGLGLAAGEIDDDVFIDLALVMTEPVAIGVFVNSEGNGMLTGPDLFTSSGASDVALLDVDGDLQLELLVVDLDGDTLTVVSAANLQPIEQHPVGDDPKAIAIGDIDGDGIDDVAVANAGSHDVSILLATGTGLTDEFRTLNSDPNDQPEAIEIRDLEVDGFGEIVTLMRGSRRVVVYGHTPIP
ncbi:FG-GAP-like repeat-containing protein [Nannocystaceae bacterium ST9]